MRLLIYYSKTKCLLTHTIDISSVSTLHCTYIIELNIYLTFHEKWIKCTVRWFVSMSSFIVNTSLLVCWCRLLVLLPWVQTHQRLWTTRSTASLCDYWMSHQVFWRARVSWNATAGQGWCRRALLYEVTEIDLTQLVSGRSGLISKGNKVTRMQFIS